MDWYDFSIIKYIPNLKRGEVINIGLVVNGPNGWDIRLLDSYAKIRMLDGESNQNSLNRLSNSLNDLFISDQSNAIEIINESMIGINISTSSTFQLRPYETYNQKIQQLYDDLIKPFSALEPRKKRASCRLVSDIKRRLNRQSLISNNADDLYHHKVIPSFVLNEKSGITADFMLKNGRYHMSSVVDFNVSDTANKFKETALKVLSFHEGEKNISDNIQKYFVYAADINTESQISGHLALVDGNCHRMFNMNSDEDSSSYYDLMLQLTNHDSLNLRQ
ncbi:DUF3037 domain-containing protein [Vibrio sp. 070316B]|uniref:DUF3037 domain-containing protein n=1 Tax=Vibrio sp. 070316B TaxID=2607608 RepID=UPI00149383B7|nr:DUF3037 domain-containing protein [Vibrio sp. 070316B]NOI38919.1 DUF3037 domain-containing protein [Vibrio sp. 070316B]